MTRDDRGPSHDPTRTSDRTDLADERTPAARPDERGAGERRAAEIGETAGERTTTHDEPSRGTAAPSPEEIDPKGGAGGKAGA